jgi:predicted dehydrogenase
VQAVVLCTPHPQHAEQAIAAAQAGKHVLVEKPMAIALAECDRMIAAARANKVKLGVISQRRLYPCVQRVKHAVEAGKLGEPAIGTTTVMGWRGPEYYALDAWRGTWQGEGGGVLVNQAPHQLDLFQWIMGPVEELFGYWANLNHPYIEVEDTAIAVVRFQSGALGTILLSNSQNPGLYGNVHIHGRNGASIGVQTDGGSMFVSGVTAKVDPPINDLWTIPGEESSLAQWQAEDRKLAETVDVMTHFHRLQIQDFVQAILADRDPMIRVRKRITSRVIQCSGTQFDWSPVEKCQCLFTHSTSVSARSASSKPMKTSCAIIAKSIFCSVGSPNRRDVGMSACSHKNLRVLAMPNSHSSLA